MNPLFLTPGHVDRILAYMWQHAGGQRRTKPEFSAHFADFLSFLGIDIEEPITLTIAPPSQKLYSFVEWEFQCPCGNRWVSRYSANILSATWSCDRCRNPSVRGERVPLHVAQAEGGKL